MENIAKVFAIFKALGVNPDVKSFENRIVMQKTICMLNLMGLKTGFEFGMYLRGPYSPALTKEIFTKINRFEKLQKSVTLTAEETAKLDELREVAGLKASTLEIAATFGYLTQVEHKRPREAVEILRATKKFYTLVQIMDGVSVAKQLLFKPTEEQIRRLKEEFSAWEQFPNPDFDLGAPKNGM